MSSLSGLGFIMKKMLLALSLAVFGGHVAAQQSRPVDPTEILALCNAETDGCLSIINTALAELRSNPPAQEVLASVLAQLAAIAINTARIDPAAAEDMGEALRNIAAMSPDARQADTLMALSNEVSSGLADGIDMTAFAASPS